jgi:cell division protein FtsN
MAHDYKNSGSRNKGAAKGAPAWLWLVTGLSLGLFVAGLAYLGLNRPEPRPEPPAKPAAPKKVEKKPEPKPEPVQPRFEFYDMLSESEEVVPERELAPKVKPDGVPQVKQPGTYVLQAGSFRTAAQADQRKAQILLLGLPVEIRQVTTADKGSWNRVMVGPFNDLQPLNDARDRLKQEGIDILLLKVKQP